MHNSAMLPSSSQRTTFTLAMPISLLLACTSQMALAQPAAPEAMPSSEDSATSGTGMGDIVVTARKRSERAQDVPIALIALGRESLAQSHITSLADLPRVAPGFFFTQVGLLNSVRSAIRGIGVGSNSAIEPDVAPFLNGVYVPRSAALYAAFLDIDSVEVLKGPQGTLYGRNALAGTVNMTSALPGKEFGARFNAEYGSGNRARGEIAVDLPVSSTLSFRIAGLADLFGGLYHNKITQQKADKQNIYAGRATAKAEFSPELTGIFVADYARITGTGFTPSDTNYFPAGTYQTFSDRFNGEIGDNNIYDRKVIEPAGDHAVDTSWGLTSNISLDLGSGYKLKSITGYRYWKDVNVSVSALGLTTAAVGTYNYNRSRSISQDLQISSPDDLFDGMLSFIGGLYYFQEKYNIVTQFFGSQLMCDKVVPAAIAAGCTAAQKNPLTDLNYSQKTRSYAVYGEGDIKFAPGLDLVVGARWTKDHKDALVIAQTFNPAGGILLRPENTPLKTSDSRPTFKANLNWRPAKDILLYASFTTGFKSGGFDSGGGPQLRPNGRGFRAATVKSYEAGAKTSWLNNAITANLAIYRMQISDYQDRTASGVVFSTQNAGGLRNQGVEGDFVVSPIKGLSLNASIAYLDSEFTSYPNASNLPGLPGSRNLAGTRPTFAPKWTGSLGGQYEGSLAGDLTWSLRTDFSFQSASNVNFVNDHNPDMIQKGYHLTSGRFTIYGPDKNWSVSVFGNNLFDKTYCTFIAYQTFSALIGTTVPGHSATKCFTGRPRTLGVALGTKL